MSGNLWCLEHALRCFSTKRDESRANETRLDKQQCWSSVTRLGNPLYFSLQVFKHFKNFMYFKNFKRKGTEFHFQPSLLLSPGDLPNPGIEPASLMSPDWQVGSLPLLPPGKYLCCLFKTLVKLINFCKAVFYLSSMSHLSGVLVNLHHYRNLLYCVKIIRIAPNQIFWILEL